MSHPTPERNHSEEQLSPAMEDYLKTIYRLQEQDKRVNTQAVADYLAVAPASVTHMVKRLAERGLLTHQRYRGVELTEAGRRVAEEMVRHHRLLELFLTQALGFAGDEVHAEAERLEHFISERLEERIDLVLGRPTQDPHGSPIPCRPDRLTSHAVCSLADLQLYVPGIVLHQTGGLQEGQSILVLGRPAGAKLHVRVDGEECLIDVARAGTIMVRPATG